MLKVEVLLYLGTIPGQARPSSVTEISPSNNSSFLYHKIMTSFPNETTLPLQGPPQRVDHTQQMYHIFLRFCSFGAGHRVAVESLKMDSRTLQKFCRDAGLLDSTLNKTRVDLILTKLLTRRDPKTNKIIKSKKIDFNDFIYCLQECAAVLGEPYIVLQNFIIESSVQPTIGPPPRIKRFSERMKDNSESTSSNITGQANIASPYSVRRANINDLDAVVSLRIAASAVRVEQEDSPSLHLLNKDTVTRGVTAGLIENLHGGLLQPRYWIATADERDVVGVIGVTPQWNDLQGNCVWNITSLHVVPQHRGQGVESMMIHEGVIEDAAVLDLQAVSVHVPVSDRGSLQMYDAMEFVSSKTIKMVKQFGAGEKGSFGR